MRVYESRSEFIPHAPAYSHPGPLPAGEGNLTFESRASLYEKDVVAQAQAIPGVPHRTHSVRPQRPQNLVPEG